MRQKNLVAIATLAVAAVCLTFFAPISKQVTEGFLSDYVETISLFGGIHPVCVVFTVIAGLGFVAFPIAGLVYKFQAWRRSTFLSGIFFLFMQVVSLVVSLVYYDDSSLLGALISEFSERSVHPMAIVAMALTLAALLVLRAYHKEDEDSADGQNGHPDEEIADKQ